MSRAVWFLCMRGPRTLVYIFRIKVTFRPHSSLPHKRGVDFPRAFSHLVFSALIPSKAYCFYQGFHKTSGGSPCLPGLQWQLQFRVVSIILQHRPDRQSFLYRKIVDRTVSGSLRWLDYSTFLTRFISRAADLAPFSWLHQLNMPVVTPIHYFNMSLPTEKNGQTTT